MINPEIPENPFSHHNGSMLIFYELDHSFRKISDGLFVITHTHRKRDYDVSFTHKVEKCFTEHAQVFFLGS